MNDSTEPTWASVRARINGLWPRYQPTDAEAALIAQRLSGLRMRWLDAAVESYRCSDSSGVFRLADLLSHYQRIAQSGEARSTEVDRPSARTQQWADDRKDDAERCRRQLAQAPRAEVAAAVERLRKDGWLGGHALPARVAEWTDTHALIVFAALWK